MANLTREATLTLDKADIAAILTEELCRYNAFAGLRVEAVNQDDNEDFQIVMTPKPEEDAV